MAASPLKAAFTALEAALEAARREAGAAATPAAIRNVRAALALHAAAVEAAREATDPILNPKASFDPGDPKTVGRMVSMALLAQPRAPLSSVRPAYGSGVYAIYYEGDHPLYAAISGSETPIYVGKADPANGDASTPREQGPRLTGRLLEHASTIATAEAYAVEHGLPPGLFPIRLENFTCRKLVCATNAQLVAERHLIRTFWPVWNSDTKACWGMSKHGDAASTRRNKRPPWDVVHPGRLWALDGELEDKIEPAEIKTRIDEVLEQYPARRDHAQLLEEMLTAFRQDDWRAAPEAVQSPLQDAEGPSQDEVGGEDDA